MLSVDFLRAWFSTTPRLRPAALARKIDPGVQSHRDAQGGTNFTFSDTSTAWTTGRGRNFKIHAAGYIDEPEED